MASPTLSLYSSDGEDMDREEEIYATPPEGVAEDVSDQDDSGPENDSPELRRDRNANDQRLRGRFEHIFAKYSRDFTEVGDQIDIETGEIVVDNGHLRNMLHEADPGEGSRSLQLVRDFAVQLEHEDDSGSETEDVNDDDRGDDDADAESDVSSSDVDELANDYERVVAEDAESESEDETDQDASVPEASMDVDLSKIDPHLRQLIQATSNKNSSEHPSGPAEQDLHEPDPDHPVSANIISLPALQQSLQELGSTTAISREVDAEAIQKLGKDIADQLARYVGRKEKTRTKRKAKMTQGASTWDYPELPAFKRRRVLDQPSRPQLGQLSDILSPRRARREPRESIWAPVHHPKQPGGRRARGRDSAPKETRGAPPIGPATTGQSLPAAEDDGNNATAVRECAHCHIKVTTAWRLGPDGENLCNACGMYWYRYDLLRPLRPPTPEPQSEDEAAEYEEHRDPYPANTSRTVSFPGYRSGAFTTEEDALIIKLKEIDCLPWERIGRFFPGRSHYGVQCRYSKRLNNQTSEGRSALVEQGFTFEEPPEADISDIFTEEQDELLVQLRENHEFTWRRIAEHFPGKTDESVEFRYNILLGIVALPPKPKKRRAALKAPENHQRSYSKEEDELIIKLREIDKLPWELLAQEFPQRTWLALQKRYVRTLAHRHQAMRDGEDDPYTHLFLEGHPDDDVRLGPADRKRMGVLLRQRREEDLALMRMKDEDGLTFEEIAEALPGRTVDSLMNRYEHLMEVNNLMNVPAPTSPREENDESNERDASENDEQAAHNAVCMIDPALMAGTALGPAPTQSEEPANTSGDMNKINDTELPFVAGSESRTPVNVSSLISDRPRFAVIKRYTKAEHARIAELRNVNLDWKTIAAELPGRTPASIASYWAQYCKHKALSSSPMSEKKKRGSKQSKALMRQAVENGMRRIPNGGKRAIELPSMTGTGHPGPMNLFTTLLRGAAEQDDVNEEDEEVDFDFANVGAGPASSSPKRPAQLNDMSDEEVDFDFAKLGQGPLDRVSATTTPAKNSVLSCTGRHNQAGISQDMSLDSGLVDYGIGTSISIQGPLGPSNAVTIPRPLISTTMLSNVSTSAESPSVIDGMPPQTPLYGQPVARPRRLNMPGRLESPPLAARTQACGRERRIRDMPRHERQSRAILQLPSTTPARGTASRPPATPIEAATPFKTPLPASSPFMAAPAPAMYSTPARYSQRKMPYFNMPKTTLLAASPAQEEELLDLPDDMVEDDMTVASSEDDVVPVHRTVAPTSFARHSSTARSLSPPGATIMDRLARIPSVAASNAGAPPFSWTDLITMALKSSGSQQSDVREMQAYLEEKFPYFKSRGEGWKRTLRAHLATSSEFQKLPGRRDIWTFRTKEIGTTPKKSNRPRKSMEPQTTAAAGTTAHQKDVPGERVRLVDTADNEAVQPAIRRDASPSTATAAGTEAADEDTAVSSYDATELIVPAEENDHTVKQTANKAPTLNSRPAVGAGTWVADMLLAPGPLPMKRGPGRPPKNGILSIAAMRALGPKRGPGRPPGAKNKPKGPQGITEYALPSSFLGVKQETETTAPEYEVPSASRDILQRQLTGSKVMRPRLSKSNISSDVAREPETSPVLDLARGNIALEPPRSSSPDNEIAGQTSVENPATRSSSPTFMRTADRTPATVYSRAGTPAQAAPAATERAAQKDPTTRKSATPAETQERAATSPQPVSAASSKAKQRLPATGRRSATPAKPASSAVEKLKQRALARGRSSSPALAGRQGSRATTAKAGSARQSMQSITDLDGSEDELA